MVNTEHLNHVSEAIAKVEQSTSAEVVVTVVRQSGNYDHVAPLVFAITFALTLALGFEAHIYREWLPFSWSPQVALLVLVVGSALLTLGISRLRRVKRALTSAGATERWVGLRAEVEFFEKVYGKTGAASGVLIFVSLLERRTMILADAPIFAKLPKETFDATLAALNARIARNELAAGLAEAVAAIGPLLAREFPIQPGDRNEISDQIVLKDD